MDIQSDRIDELHHSYSPPEGDNSLPVPARKIEDICEARDQALSLLSDAESKWEAFAAAIDETNAAIKLASSDKSAYFGPLEFGEIYKKANEKNHGRQTRGHDITPRAEIYRRRVDVAVWRHLVHSSTLADLMDAEAKSEFDESLKNPAPVTTENCFATLRSLLEQAGSMQERGVVNLFNQLNSRDYRSNDCFHLGKRIVVDYMVETTFSGGYTFKYGRAKDALIDLERAICLIEKIDVPGHQNTIVRRLESGPMRPNRNVTADDIGKDNRVFEDDIWKIRWYAKGTCHVYIKPAHIRARLNQMIAAHFGAVMGDGTDRPNAHDPCFTGKVRTRQTGVSKVDRNAYYTPPALAEAIVEISGLKEYIESNKGAQILEPSCGHGELMVAAFNAGCRYMHGVENHLASANAAQDRLEKMYNEDGSATEHYNQDRLKVYRSSFGTWEPNRWERDGYSHIIMNPPFDHQLRHVVKAYGYLRKGHVNYKGEVTKHEGCLVSVMGANVLTNQSHDFGTFRDWLKAKNAKIYRLPSGSFKPSGTDVETILIKIPAEVSR